VHRQIVANDGRGGQLVEVENEADWNVLFLRGSVRTRLVVAQDMRAGTMEFALAPGAPSVLRELYGRWTIEAIDPEDTEHESFPPSPDTEGLDAPNYRTEQPAWCFVTLTQRLAPKNVPPFLFPAFAKFAKTQVRSITHRLLHLLDSVALA